MSDANNAPRGVAGHLLCAVPQLLDPNFWRTTVLMLEHSAEGAMGLVINNPVSATVAHVARSLDLDWRGDRNACVRFGGPVEPIQGWILHDQPRWDPNASEIAPGMMLTSSLEGVRELHHENFGMPPSRFIFLLGYAGWAAGQLEAEIAAGSWVLVPIRGLTSNEMGVDVEWLFAADPEEMWTLALNSIGVDPARLVGMQMGGAMVH